MQHEYSAWFEKEMHLIRPMVIDFLQDKGLSQQHATFLRHTVSRVDGSKQAASAASEGAPETADPQAGSSLTGREVEVLRLLTEGQTNMEISQSLQISHHTVKSHVIHIFNKLGVNDRTQAAVWAVKHQLLV